MRLRSCALAVLLLVTMAGCDRFANPKYERSPWGTPAQTSGSAAGSGALGSPSDLAVQGCGMGPGATSLRGAEGALCRSASDCAPVCCSCGGLSDWLASSCVAGRCAGGQVACSRTGTCQSGGMGVIIVGTGGGGGAGGESQDAGPAGDCGLTYDDDTCDGCMRESCCREEARCAADPFCGAGGVDACIAGCSDEQCVSDCDDAYASNRAANDLDACRASSCSGACG